MAGSFGEAFLGHAHGQDRVVPLEVPRGYRDARATERSVTIQRYVECRTCARRGCVQCSYAGWRIADRLVSFMLPPAAHPGTRIVVDGVGHRADGVAQGLVVEIVEPGPRADALVAENLDHETKLLTAWRMDGEATVRGRRRLRVAGVLAIIALGIVYTLHWANKPGVGVTCSVDHDCRSGMCLRLMTDVPDDRWSEMRTPRLDGTMCTGSCRSDLDCPSLASGTRMHCADASSRHEEFRQYIKTTATGLICIPDGY